MAYAEQLPSGNYRGVAVHPVTKRRKTASKHPVTGERMTPSEAQMWAEAVERDMAAGADAFGAAYRVLPPRAKGVTFADYAGDWLARKFREPATQQNYAHAVNEVGKFAVAARPIGAITHEDVERLIKEMADAGWNPPKIEQTCRIFGQVMRDAIRTGKADRDPTKGVRTPKAVEREWVLLDDDEAVRLYRAMRPDLRAIILLGYDAGLRISEALGLTETSIDWKRNQLRIVGQIDPQTRKPKRGTKGGRARFIPMTSRLARALRWHVDSFGYAPDGLLFRTSTLRGYTSTLIYPMLNRAVEAAGLGTRGFVFHDLRHAFCTRLAARETMRQVQALAGHAHASTTMRYVHHVQDETGAASAIAALGGADPLDEGDEGMGATLTVVGQ